MSVRVTELEQILKKDIATNPAIGFQNATNLQPQPKTGTTSNDLSSKTEIEFPAKDLSTMFLDSRNAKQVMYLKIEGNKVIGWESDTKRNSKK